MDKTSMCALWEKHLDCEFTTRDTEATLATRVEDAYVNHVPVLTWGRRDGLFPNPGGISKNGPPRTRRIWLSLLDSSLWCVNTAKT
jgi:hypothetical protein